MKGIKKCESGTDSSSKKRYRALRITASNVAPIAPRKTPKTKKSLRMSAVNCAVEAETGGISGDKDKDEGEGQGESEDPAPSDLKTKSLRISTINSVAETK